MKYRRREPEVVDAIQYDGTNATSVIQFLRNMGAGAAGFEIDGRRKINFVHDTGICDIGVGEWAVRPSLGWEIATDEDFRQIFEPVEQP